MKKLFIFALCLTALASCNEGAKKTENAARAERDSLNQVIAQKDDEINDMMTTLIDIEDGFREITDAQNRVTLAKQGEGTNSKQRIAENFQYIQSMMQQNKDLIAKLQQQARESSIKGDKLKKIIASLQEQMEKKDLQIAEMQAQLDLKDIHINELNNEINTMQDDARAMKSENDAQAQKLQEQDKQLNTAWFVYGTKDELKKQQILTKDGLFSKSKILQGNFNREYFTKIDIRVDRDIKLYSKDAKVLTSHPASSYRLTADANKQLILRINDPIAFWSTSKYLISRLSNTTLAYQVAKGIHICRMQLHYGRNGQHGRCAHIFFHLLKLPVLGQHLLALMLAQRGEHARLTHQETHLSRNRQLGMQTHIADDIEINQWRERCLDRLEESTRRGVYQLAVADTLKQLYLLVEPPVEPTVNHIHIVEVRPCQQTTHHAQYAYKLHDRIEMQMVMTHVRSNGSHQQQDGHHHIKRPYSQSRTPSLRLSHQQHQASSHHGTATNVHKCHLQPTEQHGTQASILAQYQIEQVFENREPATHSSTADHTIDKEHHTLATGQHQQRHGLDRVFSQWMPAAG